MRKIEYKKILIISFCILFAIVSISMAIMAGDVLHKEHCCAKDCPVCNIINISENFIGNIAFVSSSILILIAIVPLMQLVIDNAKNGKKLTLVELKVVLNN